QESDISLHFWLYIHFLCYGFSRNNYFGTGSKLVVHVFPSLVALYDLPNYFSKAYKPQQVKYFK
ncbi:hypothetical protein E1U27_15010, partial [Listeria monocytogenes]|nr:hypothetical protein [Listeria monocytogenes]EAE4546872.1 hypothetical protein [Listeria monocytogenes]